MLLIQAYLVQQGTVAAVSLQQLTQAQADQYRIKTWPDALGTQALLNANELAYVDLLAYNWLLAQGIDAAVHKRGSARDHALSGDVRILLEQDMFDIESITFALGNQSRKIGSTMMSVGSAMTGLGIAGGALPLAVAGATVCMVGLLLGTVNGLLYDNANFIGGNAEKPQLIETTRFFLSNVVSNAIGEFSPLQRYIGSSNSPLGNFFLDQANSFGSQAFVDGLGDSAQRAYRAASDFANTYLPLSPPHDPPPDQSPTWPICGGNVTC